MKAARPLNANTLCADPRLRQAALARLCPPRPDLAVQTESQIATGAATPRRRVQRLGIRSHLCAVFRVPRAAVLVFAAALCTGAAAADPRPTLPSIAQGGIAQLEHHSGKRVWAELVTPDLAAAKSFYGGLFGWTFKDYSFPGGDYAVAFVDGRPIAGLLQHGGAVATTRQPAWLTFLAVSDVDAAVRTALEHGAKLVYAPRSFPDRGRQAVLTDPEGAIFAVLASSSGDPPDFLPDVGEWVWSSLLALDPGADAAFYQTLLGYEVYAQPAEDGLEHLLLASDDSARASVNTLPAGFTRRHPHWLNFVRVADPAALTVQAVRLGGRVLVDPHADRHGGMVAVVADPAGAAVGLMEWSETAGAQ
jgi:predicted enzyme related to lactoylglutathione lyase